MNRNDPFGNFPMNRNPSGNFRMNRTIAALCFVLLLAAVAPASLAASATTSLPDTRTLLNAMQDEGNWSLPAKSYSGNRYTALSQIDKSNVGKLSVAWK